MKQLAFAAAVILAGCATTPSVDGFARVDPATIAADPENWDGRAVETTGLLAWEFENLGLWQDYESYCQHDPKAAIAVEWDEWQGVTQADNRRTVVVRGRFRNHFWVSGPQPKRIVISTGAPGPGPLEPGEIVRWQSAPLPAC